MGDRVSKIILFAMVVAALCVTTYISGLTLNSIALSDQMETQSTANQLSQLKSNHKLRRLNSQLTEIEQELKSVKEQLAAAQSELRVAGSKDASGK